MPLPYNTTELSIYDNLEKGIVHRDWYSHLFKYNHVLKNAKIGERIVEFGCGHAELLETFYRNRYRPSLFVGLDIREKVIKENKEKYSKLPFSVEFYAQDLVNPTIDLDFNADKVVSIEVIEHVSRTNGLKYLKNMKKCGSKNATFYLSTPNFNGSAAANHTYDGQDGHGLRRQEFTHDELEEIILQAGFKVVEKYATFASQKDYIPTLNDWQKKTFESLSKYYDTNLLSNLMGPIINPKLGRNILWVLTK